MKMRSLTNQTNPTNLTSIHRMDEHGMVLIPHRLITKVNWHKSNKFSSIVDLEEKVIILTKDDKGKLKLDNYSKIKISKETYQKLKWNPKDKLAITLDKQKETLTLSLHERYIPKCTFCENLGNSLVINGRGICKKHIEYILNSIAAKKLVGIIKDSEDSEVNEDDKGNKDSKDNKDNKVKNRSLGFKTTGPEPL